GLGSFSGAQVPITHFLDGHNTPRLEALITRLVDSPKTAFTHQSHDTIAATEEIPACQCPGYAAPTGTGQWGVGAGCCGDIGVDFRRTACQGISTIDTKLFARGVDSAAISTSSLGSYLSHFFLHRYILLGSYNSQFL